ncbi:DUF2505 domain-containing protein [Cellulomonas sp. JH27-2]|uniref:DUF2505 domain-containing protein n=1 Tax=Cellulomonas sp. JH27-2 TaxID=2774139 RepID=UPI0017833D47|nr:DUF2505 domain-containing protein [Cellulomonas sp. JH27-2]MBD8060405.1 DUF2505 domain-containing protein [Cellulomonas sp. JH27-2]
MRLHLRLDLATDPRTAARLLADPAFMLETIEAAGGVDGHVDVTGNPDDSFTVTTRRSLAAGQIPAHLRGFVGTRIDVRQVDAWETPGPGDERAGTVAIDIAGAPVRFTGRTRLWQSAPGTTSVEYDGDLRAAVPLFGAAVEGAAAGAIRDATTVVGRVAADRLRGRSERTLAPDDGPVPAAGTAVDSASGDDQDNTGQIAGGRSGEPPKTGGDGTVTAP